jgi:hypothetical protein
MSTIETMQTISQKGYVDVQCDATLPCPFCGQQPELKQVAHDMVWTGSRKYRRQVKMAIVSSTRTLKADTFCFRCEGCGCSSGGHHDTAQKAAEAWNRRFNSAE